MRITVLDNLNPLAVVRRAGYGQVRDGSPEESYARRLGGGFYPRFHIYINGREINLHLDQKQASYQGQKKHSGEYEGETVEREAMRIKEVMEMMFSEEQAAPPVTEPRGGFWGFWRK